MGLGFLSTSIKNLLVKFRWVVDAYEFLGCPLEYANHEFGIFWMSIKNHTRVILGEVELADAMRYKEKWTSTYSSRSDSTDYRRLTLWGWHDGPKLEEVGEDWFIGIYPRDVSHNFEGRLSWRSAGSSSEPCLTRSNPDVPALNRQGGAHPIHSWRHAARHSVAPLSATTNSPIAVMLQTLIMVDQSNVPVALPHVSLPHPRIANSTRSCTTRRPDTIRQNLAQHRGLWQYVLRRLCIGLGPRPSRMHKSFRRRRRRKGHSVVAISAGELSSVIGAGEPWLLA